MLGHESSFQQVLKQHLALYIFVSVLFVMGVIFGALLVNALSFEQQQSMALYLNSYFQTVVQGFDEDSSHSFAQLLVSHMRWVFLILIFGLSIVGLPLILIIDFVKGMLIGFSIGYLVGQFSWKGLFFAFISIAPQNLIAIPVLLISSVAALSFSLYLIRSFILNKRQVEARPFKSYLLTHLSLFALLAGAALIEHTLVPHLIDWAAPIMLEG